MPQLRNSLMPASCIPLRMAWRTPLGGAVEGGVCKGGWRRRGGGRWIRGRLISCR